MHKSKDSKQTVTSVVANCTQYTMAAKQFIEDHEDYDMIALCEHHLRGPAAEIEATRLMRQGCRFHGTWTPARQSPRSRKGTSGGTC
eukprot:6781050-Pyramimonas_sp.AAC.1